ncbi:MAG TPA: hypothetical protein VJM53_04420 [Burkholderiales bacterium]|nr:hypothetical protein [Burkholderiales bacterium]
MNNPYQAPQAQLADAPEPTRPRQINFALVLMWLSLIGGAVYGVVDMADEPDQAAAILMIAFSGVIVLVSGVPLIFIALGHNWARWAWAALLLTGWVLTFVYWEESFATVGDILIQGFLGVLDAVAIYLLFAAPSAQWFKRARSR